MVADDWWTIAGFVSFISTLFVNIDRDGVSTIFVVSSFSSVFFVSNPPDPFPMSPTCVSFLFESTNSSFDTVAYFVPKKLKGPELPDLKYDSGVVLSDGSFCPVMVGVDG